MWITWITNRSGYRFIDDTIIRRFVFDSILQLVGYCSYIACGNPFSIYKTCPMGPVDALKLSNSCSHNNVAVARKI